MCILFIANDQHPNYPLIIAANRDEFYNRPTKASGYWGDSNILAGKDLEAGGTWMGITKSGHIAALTNYRDPKNNQDDAPSRGALVSEYLLKPTPNYSEYLYMNGRKYNGFNLLYGHWQSLSVFGNTTLTSEEIKQGFYGLSNADLNTPWPKLTTGIRQIADYCTSQDDIITDDLLDVLSDNTRAPDDKLPNTGIPFEWEKALSSIFINLEGYGTRSSTVLLIDKEQQVTWHERCFNAQAQTNAEHKYYFRIKESD